jgi:CheY-like chemotaxis protein
MHQDVVVALIELAGDVVGFLFWLMLVVYLLLRFKDPIAARLANASELSVKTPIGEIAVKVATETSAALAAAESRADTKQDQPKTDLQAVQKSAHAAAQALDKLKDRCILWVDDNPHNNEYEASAFRAAGLCIQAVKTSAQAMDRLKSSRFDLVITDLTRGRDSSAGLKFIKAAKHLNPSLRILVYSSARGAHQFPEAYRLGAVGATYRPRELFDRAVELLGG